MIKQFLFFAVFFVIGAGSTAQSGYKIHSNNINITYNQNQNQSIGWDKEKNQSIVVDNFNYSPFIVVQGVKCTDFDVRKMPFTQQKIHDAEFGSGVEVKTSGIYKGKNIRLQRNIILFFPEKFENTVIAKTTFENLGRSTIQIDSVISQQLLLKSKNTKSVEQVADFVSFQGGVQSWGDDYSRIWLTPGFYQDNFQGIHFTEHTEYIGAGIPFIDVWNKSMGVALMHIEKKPVWLSLPVKVNADGSTEIAIVEKPEEKYKMKSHLMPGDVYQTAISALIFHHLDFYDALNTYAELLRCCGIDIPSDSPPAAYEPYWKSWGWEWNFTLDDIKNKLPELKKMGIKTIGIDDGWMEFYGDWNVNRSKGKFPEGEQDMVDFVKKLHDEGFKTVLWWNPQGVSPMSNTGRKRRDLLVQNEDGSYPYDDRGLNILCPAYKPSLDFITDVTSRFIHRWEIDGLYDDTRTIASIPPCYNKLHHHSTPLESFENSHKFTQVIDSVIQSGTNGLGTHEVCICAAPHSPYNMPYYQMSSASDPVNLFQLRERIKVEKAIHGPKYSVGDCYQVPSDEWSGASVNESFESALGTGALVTTYYRDLDSLQIKKWEKGFSKYHELRLSNQEYLNLYDIVFDEPEIHVVQKDDELYYGIYTDFWSEDDGIILRGLNKEITYSVFDYYNNVDLGVIYGNNPILKISFTGSLLIRLKPM